MSAAEQALATMRDYVERSTHWQEGGADRHEAKLALDALDACALDDHSDDHSDEIEWLEKGVAEWRSMYFSKDQQATAARATARVAIAHLQAVLNKARTHDEQQRADTAARDWLESIGSDPT